MNACLSPFRKQAFEILMSMMDGVVGSKIEDELWDGSPETTAKKVESWVWEEVDVERLPYLTRELYASGAVVPGQSLVRWIGMVQDQGSPEYFPVEINDRNTMYRDVFSQTDWDPLKEGSSGIGERQPLFCVPVPGLSSWARSAILRHSRTTLVHSAAPEREKNVTKRNREEESDDEAKWVSAEDDENKISKSHETTTQIQLLEEAKKIMKEEDSPSGNKEKKSVKHSEPPLRPEVDIECVIRFYGPDDAPKLNSLIEVVALLGSEVPQPTETDVDDWHASASRVARLHALAIRPLDIHRLTQKSSFNDAVPRNINFKDDAVLLHEARDRIIDWIAETSLNGDTHAAEYLFLASCIAKRFATITKTERALGLLSLEIITPTDCAAKLQLALAELVPSSRLVKSSEAKDPPSRGFYNEHGERVDQSTDFNHEAWIGKDERLAKDSPLQSAESTVLIIDHDSLFWPTLLSLIGDSKYVPYDFGYNEPTRFPVDLPTVVVTNNRKGVGCDCSLALNDFTAMEDDSALMSLPDASLLRNYIAQARNHKADIPLHDDLPQVIQDDFVDARSKGLIPHAEAEDRIHLWLTLARLYARSLFADEITIDHWKHCKKLETTRIVRLNSMRRLAGL